MATLPNQHLGLGRKPALVVVDATVGFTDPTSPLGTESSQEVAAIAQLLQAFRKKRLPVVFTTNSYSNAAEASVFREKVPVLNQLVAGGILAAIDPRISPRSEEIVLNKGVPSAFFDSPLRQTLINLGVDSTMVVGFTTSGCVRATAVDALQSNFRLIVVRDACGDRDIQAHEANLRDLQLKYGDVVSLENALQMINNLPC
jgi:maleamate amidohydrolase